MFISLTLICVLILAVIVAALNPLQESRSIEYVIGGLSGVVALALLLLQPLLAIAFLPHGSVIQQRRWHRWIGTAIVITVALHISGLYLASPQDMIDAMLLVAPTPFSVYGVVGLWTLVLTATLVAFRKRLRLNISTWNIIHNSLAVIVVITSVVHALMIEGAMGYVSKLILCICLIGATTIVVAQLRIIRPRLKKR